MIREEDGSDRPYLLLRLIPVEYLQNTWAFPTEFPLAEISMIVNLSINQNLRRAVDMAEHVNQAKTRFLSTMSHDIRTPMNAVIGMTKIAKLHLDDAGYVRDCLDRVSASRQSPADAGQRYSGYLQGQQQDDARPCAVSLSEEVES